MVDSNLPHASVGRNQKKGGEEGKTDFKQMPFSDADDDDCDVDADGHDEDCDADDDGGNDDYCEVDDDGDCDYSDDVDKG